MPTATHNNDVWSFLPQPLSEYDVSEVSAFIPPEPPLTKLSDPYYSPWEDLAYNSSIQDPNFSFRDGIRKLPLLSLDRLTSYKEFQRAYSLLAYFSNKYVWGVHEQPEDELPTCIAVPFCKVSEYLGINPIHTNSAIVLWNWKLLNPELGIDLDNLDTLYSFTRTSDETWFCLVSLLIEYAGGDLIKYSGLANHAALNNDLPGVISALGGITATMKKFSKLMFKMPEKCSTHVFYWSIRPNLAGWESIESSGLKGGVTYLGVDTEPGSNAQYESVSRDGKVYRKYSGASAAQSSIIQFIDIALGIKHYATQEEFAQGISKYNSSSNQSQKYIQPPGNPYLLKMRDYMTMKHRQFLLDFEKACIIRKYVFLNTQDVSRPSGDAFSELLSYREDISDSIKPTGSFSTKEQLELLDAYNRSISSLKSFRDAHFSVIKNYIFGYDTDKPRDKSSNSDKKSTQMPLDQKEDSGSENATKKPTDSGYGSEDSAETKENALGTGGTDALSFLGQLKNETKATRLGS
ncbi:hypothetical protein BB560_003357 [Smittium megazygosporum]|uniref:Indoleamine 2,3-dioxygenase n=1 Tax=Smittium megazygosporum TaxID=133381 RepID=A0A2T9ZC76_9FUNG|nr:hypothetical protein BB560_003357 [Smittium megazygosporum]